MGSHKARVAALLFAGVSALGLVGVTAGVAQAVPLNRVSPAYPDNASCQGARTTFSAWPDVSAEGVCYYSQTNPLSQAPVAGYYFLYALSDAGACGIGCHTPPPAPPFQPPPPGGGGGGGPSGGDGCQGKNVCQPN